MEALRTNIPEKELVARKELKAIEESENFSMACRRAKVEPTHRQASKFRNKHGAAYRVTHGLSPR